MFDRFVQTRRGRLSAALLALTLGFPGAAAFADPATSTDSGSAGPSVGAEPPSLTKQTPEELQGVDIVDKRGAVLPGDVTLTDSNGEAVRFGELLNNDKPTVLVFAYFTCPILCSMVHDGVVNATQEMGWELGDQFQVITVSIDPSDTPEDAAEKKNRSLARLQQPDAGDGWKFLVGQDPQVRRLADAAGFNYNYLPDRQQYAHASGIIVLTPQGKVARYLYGVQYPAQTLRLTLVEASDGTVGSALDKVLLSCLQYNPDRGDYTYTAMTLMSAGGAVTLIGLTAVLSMAFYFERRGRALHETSPEANTDANRYPGAGDRFADAGEGPDRPA